MASATAQENLDERIERIRKRDEEIEKKHREAEEDRLMALKDNAMVKTRAPKDEDWPKGHKYDTLDFTYDQPELAATEDDKPGQVKKTDGRNPKAGRDYKKFADGEGPPPDPSYNFLADAERDGTSVTEKNTITGDKKDWRQQSGGNNNQRNKNGLNNSFRGRKQGQGGGRNNGNNGQQRGGYQRQDSNNEYSSWKNERERIDEARIGRQKVGEGKWRREWDNDKHNEDENISKMEKLVIQPNGYNSSNNQQPPQKSPTTAGSMGGRQKPHYQPLSSATNDGTSVEKRGNITVSVSQDGEVKSVKLQSAKAIGTGRVGPRQPPKTQFLINQQDSTYPEMVINPYQQPIQQHHHPLPQYHQQPPPQQQQQQQQQQQLRNTDQYYMSPVSPISPRRIIIHDPIIKQSSVQDRLKKHYNNATSTTNTEKTSATDNSNCSSATAAAVQQMATVSY